MSSALYRLGKFAAHRSGLVLLVALLVTLLTGGAAVLFGGTLNDSFSIPGTEAQRGLDTLKTRFHEVSGASATIVVSATTGHLVTDADVKSQVAHLRTRLDGVAQVVAVSDPYGKNKVGPTDTAGQITSNGRFARVMVQFAGTSIGDVKASSLTALTAAARPESGDEFTTTVGGSVFTQNKVPISITEVTGLLLAVIVLLITFGSALAAGLPVLNALLGVALTMAATSVAASVTSISSSTPTLAMMIGLALGIDYALFIISRHREQLSQGLSPRESIARALATAGSAVVFAGATVIIALCGLLVAQIPFLGVMGLDAAVAVAVAVLIALTVLPASLSLLGERMRPKPGSRAQRRAASVSQGGRSLGARWVQAVTRFPVITVILVVAGLAVLALPARDLRLALPDTGTQPKGTAVRTTYDLVADEFGQGYNAPLLITVDIIASTDPLKLMDDLAVEFRSVPGVHSIQLATPNQNADLGIIVVIPEHGATAESTATLVQQLRDRRSALEQKYHVTDLTVTGQTAVAIDVSNRLGSALLPFGLVVVGLSLLLLTVVFRSIAVPVKASIGFILSVTSAFGVVSLIFEHGWLNSALNIDKTGPVISFMPIIVMGVLFGLAMDYEVFLVARVREDYVHGGDAQSAIRTGVAASSRVVTSAAIIMCAVFAAFVPEGTMTIKPIAAALAVGVFIDAFIVRMTLVPAVLALLGRAAWWLPGWLDRRLPVIDVEGEALIRHLEHEGWVQRHGPASIRVEDLVYVGDAADHGHPVLGPVSFAARPGDLVLVHGASTVARRALAAALGGLITPTHGTVVVADRLVPEESRAVRSRVALVDPISDDELAGVSLGALIATSVQTWPHRQARQTEQILDPLALSPRDPADQLSALDRHRLAAALALATDPAVLILDGARNVSDPDQRRMALSQLASACARGTTVVLSGFEPFEVLNVLPDDRIHSLDLDAQRLTTSTMEAAR